MTDTNGSDKLNHFFQLFRDYWSYYPVQLKFDKGQDRERGNAKKRLANWKRLVDQVPDDMVDDLVFRVSENHEDKNQPNLQTFWNHWRIMARNLPGRQPDPEEFLREEKEACERRMATPAFNFQRQGFPCIRTLEIEELPSWVRFERKVLDLLRTDGLLSMSRYLDLIGEIPVRDWIAYSVEEQESMLRRWEIPVKEEYLTGRPEEELGQEAADRMNAIRARLEASAAEKSSKKPAKSTLTPLTNEIVCGGETLGKILSKNPV